MKSASEPCRRSEPRPSSAQQLSVDVTCVYNVPASAHSAPPRTRIASTESDLSPASSAVVASVVGGITDRVVSAEQMHTYSRPPKLKLIPDTPGGLAPNPLSPGAFPPTCPFQAPVHLTSQATSNSPNAIDPSVVISVSTDDDEQQSPAKSIFDDHPLLTGTVFEKFEKCKKMANLIAAVASLSPPSTDPPAPPLSITEIQPPLPPRKDKKNLKIRVPKEEDAGAKPQSIMSVSTARCILHPSEYDYENSRHSIAGEHHSLR